MRFGIRQIIFLTLLLAMPVATYLFVFKPRNDQIATLREENVRKQAKLRQLEAVTRNIEDLGHEIDKLAVAIELYEQKLPAAREVEQMLSQVWQLAARHSLTPKSIRTDKPIISAQYAELPIKMVIIGDFDGFYGFLIDLERLRRVTRTPKMKLVKLHTQEGQMQADMLLSIFYESNQASSRKRVQAVHAGERRRL